MPEGFIFKISTGRAILQMLDDWRRGFPRFRPRQRRRGGIAGKGGARLAYCKADPDDTTTIQAFLNTDLTGLEVTVNFLTVGNTGVGLNNMVPRLSLGQVILVISAAGEWYCTTIFQESRSC